jgi:hypothetical protein
VSESTIDLDLHDCRWFDLVIYRGGAGSAYRGDLEYLAGRF